MQTNKLAMKKIYDVNVLNIIIFNCCKINFVYIMAFLIAKQQTNKTEYVYQTNRSKQQ